MSSTYWQLLKACIYILFMSVGYFTAMVACFSSVIYAVETVYYFYGAGFYRDMLFSFLAAGAGGMGFAVSGLSFAKWARELTRGGLDE